MTDLSNAAVFRSIQDRLARVRADSPAQWGRMSAHQMICHLADSFRGTMGERKISPATGWPQRTIVKWVALYAPMPWPKGLPTRPEVDQKQGGTRPGNFETDRADLVRVTERFCDPQRGNETDSHPIFGSMSRSQWLRWGYLHMDHHLRQFGL